MQALDKLDELRSYAASEMGLYARQTYPELLHDYCGLVVYMHSIFVCHFSTTLGLQVCKSSRERRSPASSMQVHSIPATL